MKKLAIITTSFALLATPVLAQSTTTTTTAPAATTTGAAPADAKFSTVAKDEMFSSKLKGLNITNQKDETVGEITDLAFKNDKIAAMILS
ncbi:MAG: PRC-barrel domain-containing protein, partial [Tardiphaga sp.]